MTYSGMMLIQPAKLPRRATYHVPAHGGELVPESPLSQHHLLGLGWFVLARLGDHES